MNKEIIPTQEKAIKIFTNGKIDYILHEIEQEVISFVPDLSTSTSRKEIASLAMKVSKSKVVIDKAGKELTSKWKEKSKIVDKSRKESRDFLDMLRDKVRKPLTDWENEQKEIEEKRRVTEEINNAHEESLLLNDIFNREKELAERERLIFEQQEEERQRIFNEKAKRDRIEREKKIKEDAIIEGKLRAEREAKEEIEKQRLAKIAAEENAERERLRAIEIEKQAEIEKQNAIIRANNERIIKEEKEKQRLQKISEDKEHRRTVNNEALQCLLKKGIDFDVSKKIIKLIASGDVKNISINY